MMRKFFTIMMVAIISLLVVSCDDRDEVVGDGDTFSKMADVTGSFTNANNYAFTQGISIAETDVVLVYKRVGDAWQIIPKTIYLQNVTGLPTAREFDYNFVFDSQNVQIRIDDENFNLSTEMTPAEINQNFINQRFRIVLVPASQGRNANIDYSDYNSVIKFYNIPDKK